MPAPPGGLAGGHDNSAFQVFWPKEKKDAAIAEIAAFLRLVGDFLRYEEGDEAATFPWGEASLHLPRLTAPATPEDVKQGRAIFALEGERRVVKLPSLPLEASWITLKTRPYMSEKTDGSGQTAKTVRYDTRGKVFQAEEVLVDGKWERYFGFAAPGSFAKVPAAEIEFPEGYEPQRLSHGFEASLTCPELPSDFDLGQPGTYELRAQFEAPEGPSGKAVGGFFRVGE